MLSVNSITTQNPMNALGTGLVPETGEFDFLNYLLGLQVSDGSQGSASPFDLAKLMADVESSEVPDPLKDLFSKKEGASGPELVLAMQQNAQVSVKNLLPNTVKAEGVDQSQIRERPMEVLTQARGPQIAPEVGVSPAGKAGERTVVRDREVIADSLPGFKKVDKKVENASDVFEAQTKERAIQRYSAPASARENSEKPDSQKASEFAPVLEGVDRLSAKTGKGAKVTTEEGVKEVDSSQKEVALQTNVLGADGEVVEKRSLASNLMATSTTATVGRNESKPMEIPEVFRKVESMVNHGGGKMTVSLTPPDLGRVDVLVKTKGKNVEIKIESQNEVAKAALEARVDDLRSSMQTQDLNLTKVEVQVAHETSGKGLEFNLFQDSSRQFQQSQGFGSSEHKSPWKTQTHGNSKPNLAVASVGAMPPGRTSAGSGRVDMRI